MTQRVASLEVEITAPTSRVISDLSQLKREVGATMGETVKANDRATQSATRFANQLTRTRETLGMSAPEIQQYRAALQAIAAENAGRTDLANRIKADAAAIRQATEAAQAAAAAHQLFEARVRAGVEALKQEERAAEAQAQTIARLRAMLDPAAEAQNRLNVELGQARQAMAAAGLSGEEMARVEALITARHRQLTTSSGATRAGMQQLGFQLNDVATSFQGGIAPMTIFAQQGSQVIQAVQLMAGESKGFVGFLAGPWGAILTAATVVLAPFVAKLFEGGAAANSATGAYKTLADATAALDEATGRAHKSKEQEIQDSVRATKAFLTEALAKRQLLASRLEGFKQGIDAPIGGTVGGGAQFAAAASAQMTAASIAANEKAIAEAQKALRGADFVAIQNDVAAATDKMTAARQRYTAVERVLQAAVVAGTISQTDANRQLLLAAQRLDAVKKADKTAAAAARDHRHELVEQAKAAREAAAAAAARAKVFAEMNKLNLNPVSAQLDKGIEKGWAEDWANTLKQIAQAQDEVATQSGQAVTDRIEAANQQLQTQADLWGTIANAAANAAQSMQYGFGEVGRAIGAVAATFADYRAQQAQALIEHERLYEQAKTQGQRDQENGRFALQNGAAQIKLYGDMIDAAQGFFKKGSAGYKALGAAEKAYRATELAMAVANIARQIGLIGARTAATVAGHAIMAASSTAETGVEVANSAAQATASGAAGVAAQSKLPFPANIAAMAATAAALVGFGVAMLGGGGGGAKAPPTNTGTGTVFGDSSAQSQSLANSIDALKEVDTLTMRYSSQMLDALKNIERAVGGLTNSVINAGNIGSNLGVTESSGGLLGTKKKIVASGLFGGAQSLTDILAGSFDVDYFADVSKKKFLGSTKIKSTFADAGTEIGDQFALILKGFYSDVEAAAGPLGASLDDVHSRLANFVVDIGRIDTKGLTGEEIQKKLEAVFSAEGDRLAAAALPGLQKFAQAGEGYLQTLTRVATTIESVSSSLDMLGKSAQGLGIDGSMKLAGMFDSLSDFTDAANAYFDAYYSDAEKAAAKTAQLGKAFDMLGVSMPTSIAGFRALVDAQDLTTAAGQSTYATLLKLAPAFADLQGAAASATDILAQRADLERQILELQGDTAAIRAFDLKGIDDSNKALQLQYWALRDQKDATDAATQAAQAAASAEQALASQRAGLQQQLWELQGNTAAVRKAQLDAITDAQSKALQQAIFDEKDRQAAAQAAQQAAEQAAQAADQLRQQWASVASGIMDEVKRIRGLTDAAGGSSFASLQAQFNAANALARSTDPAAQDAAKSLPGLSQALLEMAAKMAGSEQELTRIQAMTANSLSDTAAIINAGAFSANDNSAKTPWYSSASSSSGAATDASNDLVAEVRQLRAEVAGLRAERLAADKPLLSSVDKGSNVLDRVSRASGNSGNALAVTEAAAA